jgi:AAA domain
MKLIVIHGPPAAGKLTVATALAKLTGFKVFHNHLSIDCTKPVFEFGSGAFWDINAVIRCEVIAHAARQNIDLIHTFCYGKGEDDEYFRRLIAAAENNGGIVHPVVLNCSDDVRRTRIVDASRVDLKKLTDPSAVGRPHDKFDLGSAHPDLEDVTLFIDNSDLSPEEAASLIISRFGLETAAESKL